jgi:hypothetical protein
VAMISAAANADPDVRVVDLRGVGSDAAATLRDLVSAARVDGEPGDADEAHADERVVVVLDDAEHLDPATDDALEALVALGPRHRVRAIVGVDNRAALRAYAGGVAALRRTRRGLILQPDIDDGELFGVRLRLLPEEHFPVGRGFLVDGKDITRVQVAAAHG